jgi:UDP-glucose 4-epimerase
LKEKLLKALVTGGAGFIGSHIVDLLIEKGHDVAVVDSLVGGRRENVHSLARLHVEDIRSTRLADIVRAEQPEVIFHEAAQMSVKKSTDDPLYDADVNVRGLLNLLEAATASGVRKVVFASSGATYGNPDYLPMDEQHPLRPASPYGITKMVAEHYLKYYATDRGLQYSALRYGNVYGPRQDAHGEAGVVAIFTTQLLSGQTPTIHWDGEQVRDYVYVGDVAAANVAAATAGDNATYCIGTGVGTSVNQIFAALTRALGVSVTPRRSERRAGDLRAAFFDTRRAAMELAWQAEITLEDGIGRTVEAFRAEFGQRTQIEAMATR